MPRRRCGRWEALSVQIAPRRLRRTRLSSSAGTVALVTAPSGGRATARSADTAAARRLSPRRTPASTATWPQMVGARLAVRRLTAPLTIMPATAASAPQASGGRPVRPSRAKIEKVATRLVARVRSRKRRTWPCLGRRRWSAKVQRRFQRMFQAKLRAKAGRKATRGGTRAGPLEHPEDGQEEAEPRDPHQPKLPQPRRPVDAQKERGEMAEEEAAPEPRSPCWSRRSEGGSAAARPAPGARGRRPAARAGP